MSPETELPDDSQAEAGALAAAAALEEKASESDQTPPGEIAEAELGASLPDLSVESTGQANQAPALPYPVVGFGASAGGLTAFREVLENLNPDTGMAFVLVTHMAPDHRSYLTEILERYTRIPVRAVVHGERPEPNHLYVMQPEQRLQLRAGAFYVEERTSGRGPHVIDTFFRSLAADQKNHAIGVVLSGADSDGASGLKAIKGEGGIALVQSPGSAAQPGMPRSSIAADHVDLVVPPAELGVELGRLAAQFSRPELRSLESGVVPPSDEYSFQKILQLLRSVSGLDLRQYKPETLRRRMIRRLVLLRKESLAEYFRFLQVRPDELRLLQEDLLISVTRFFRDSGFWESLRQNVFPALLRDRPADSPVRVWCAGCSSGEEAYSLAITLIEYMSLNSLDIPLQIFGTDASDQSIDAARLAVYPETLADEISQERLRRFFVKVERGYQVSKRVRDTCIFARQILCNDPPFSHIDILSCRNVMIYFDQALQRQVMVTFHYALEPGGYMLLGMSEGLRDYSDLFSTVDRKNRIYMKSGAALPHIADLPRSYAISQLPGVPRPTGLNLQAESNLWPELELQRAADRIVLARFGPAGLIVDEEMNVRQSRGHTAPYLELTPGGVSWNLLRVLKDGVATEARNAVQRAIRENVPITATSTLMDKEKGQQTIHIEVLPITSAIERPRCFLVLFQPEQQTDQVKPNEQVIASNLTTDEKERLIAQLRQDLTSTRFHLQSLVEERDARNQELVSVNEEIQSANEELQSTNEELETTKEELQSANEELQTVNEELLQRNNVLMQTGNDLTNLLNSVNIPLLMLTNELHIRLFTPPMQRLLSVRSADVGRSISEIRFQLSIDDLEPILREVLETLGTRELEVQDREGRWYLLRVRPYRTAENKIEGLVVVFLDVDQLRSSQQHLLQAHHFTSAVVEGVPVPIVVLDENCAIQTANNAFRELSQMDANELEGRSLPDLVKLLWGIESMGEQLQRLLDDPTATLEFEHDSQTARRKTVVVKGQVVRTNGRKVLLLVMEDITLRREAELEISKQKEALEYEMERAAFTLNRTKEQLRGLTSHLFHVQEEERQRVARELHDDVSQRLSFLDMLLSGVSASVDSPDFSEKLQSARTELQGLNTDVRELSHRLHPKVLKDLGLAAALRALVEEFDRREGMPATFSSRNIPKSMPDEASTAIYRITQEALRNVAKHAGRTHVKVGLQSVDHSLKLTVRDFGVGFDADAAESPDGLGLISMQERARIAGGSFAVDSELGAGTTINVVVPLE
ncbi:MAG TPA: CheR family methyltransferase [Acidobacteriaceae bacterium]|nr:CheR family methyltransferase [Acidobacteriaceae bacterium]